jgi:UDP-N-acetyl-D-mannosaminuronic acid dehydrogenase
MSRRGIVETVSVVGLGYIGLPTAAAFAARGIEVIGVDVNAQVVQTINRGEIHIVEPDLDKAVRQAVTSGRLRATLTPAPADAFLIAVPTPINHADHSPDLSFVEAASRAIAPVLQRGNLVVLESTSPVGTTERMAACLAEMRPDLSFPQQKPTGPDVHVAHCPERVLPGRVLQEIVCNDRIVGGMTRECAERAKALYEIFVAGQCLVTDVRTAEMCKLAENAFRDLNIAYANELSRVCERMGIDVWELIQLANRHPRVKILQPGAGVGGHCIAVDPWFIVASAPEESRLIRAAREANDEKPRWLFDKICQAADRYQATHGVKPVIAALGLAFKPDIDDLRESPALQIACDLHRAAAGRVMVVEPHIDELPTSLAGCKLVRLDTALAQADVLAILVAHKAFHALNRTALRPGQQVVDAVGLLSTASRHLAQSSAQSAVAAE